LIPLKYHGAIADAEKELGDVGEIRKAFATFQELLHKA
jgi:hypothetical protein